ncbi:TIGR02302 family protein [Alisedimentitalea sp. MJ-SS2]|uniref:TIGR02302 family protein n=1 Tax=Aliisedimentitalea sp. MJ-SS2 TaxID=3049795 RepID=UPI00290B9E2A|nr:TIGR02302 family protein [Alisedimentitalea sp. MJ-SS2]MDU8926140.1 TIGR02302 family protein [Alisedimentitalea sp. MJ-SS2]
MIARKTRHPVLDRLRWPIGLTRAGMLAEQVTRGFWPVWSVVLAVLGALMLGVQDLVAPWVVWTIAVLAALAVLVFVLRGLWRFHWPHRAEAIERLDRTMPGRPIQAVLDDQVIGAEDAASRTVWQAHQMRMQTRARMARAVRPDLRVSARDPFGLRYMALLTFLVALLFGSLWKVSSVSELTPGGVAHAAAGPSWEGWVEPPSYTGLPVLYLADIAEDAFAAPSGSRITLRLYGEPGAFDVSESLSSAPLPQTNEPTSEGYDFTLEQSGELSIDGQGGRRWQITMLPDAMPEIDATGPAETSALGAFTMPFSARDDYEVMMARATITLDLDRVDRRYGLSMDPEPRPQIDIDLPLPVARNRQDFEEVLIEDFSEHAWANLPVTITLSAEDAAGNIGTSPAHEIDLAARHFFDPMAAAVIEQRRDLLWNRDNAGRVAQVMRAMTHRPEGLFKRETNYLRMRFILRRIEALSAYGVTDEQRDEIAEALWELALQLEEGTLADALERMRQAQERLSEAMKNGASDAEIARLMEELRQATRDYMQQLERQFAQENRGNQTDQPDQGQRDENTMTMTQDDIQRMMDRIQELMEQGRMAEAQQALDEFQQMMENMRMTEGQGGQGQSPGEQAMEGLNETLREQQGLSDQAFRDLQEQFNPGARAGESQGNEGRSGGQGRGQSHEGQGGQGQGQDGEEQGGGGQSGPGGQDLGQSLADRQQALRRQLEQQRGALPGAGTEEGDAARDALDRAGRAMDGAEDALRRDDLPGAIDKQAEAMENLREGMRNLGEALAQGRRDRNQGQQGQNPENFAGQGQTDPLGRNLKGQIGDGENMLQGEDVYRRARDLLDEIRRRSGEQTRPEEERNYLERLLDRF